MEAGVRGVEIRLSEVDGKPVAEVDGLTVTGRGNGSPLPEIARKLMDLGYSPSTVATVTRGGREAFVPTTLGAWGKLAVSEGDARSVRFVDWRPFEGVKG